MTYLSSPKGQKFVTFEDGTKKPTCDSCRSIFPYTLIGHTCPEKHGKLHKCMRCGLIFECPTPETCVAQYEVLPVVRTSDGELVDHCPPAPTWDWIRDLVLAREEQLGFMNGLRTEEYGRCKLRDGNEYSWRCHKKANHPSACSCHNDCGEPVGDGYCSMPPDHAGRHGGQSPTEEHALAAVREVREGKEKENA